MRITTTGNDRTHIVAEGYLDRSRFDVPLTRDEDCPGAVLWIVAGVAGLVVCAVAWWAA